MTAATLSPRTHPVARAADAVGVLVALGALGYAVAGLVASARSTSEFAGLGIFLALAVGFFPAVALAAYGSAAALGARHPRGARALRTSARGVVVVGVLFVADLGGWLPLGGLSFAWRLLAAVLSVR